MKRFLWSQGGKSLCGTVENSTLKPVASIPDNEVVTILVSQYEDSMHKYGMHGVDCGIQFRKYSSYRDLTHTPSPSLSNWTPITVRV
jgi:hypothetical protein